VSNAVTAEGETNLKLTMVYQAFKCAISLELNLHGPLVQQSCWGDDESGLAFRVLRWILHHERDPKVQSMGSLGQ